MAEQITLTTPIIIPEKITSNWKVVRLSLDIGEGRFVLVVKNNLDELIEVSRKGIVAIDLMKILNKSNNTTKSMEKRALEWFQTQPEGISFIGSITGIPD